MAVPGRTASTSSGWRECTSDECRPEEDGATAKQRVQQALVGAALHGDAAVMNGVHEEAVQHRAHSALASEDLEDKGHLAGAAVIEIAAQGFHSLP